MLTIYKASAGSGKTYTLTFEYIKLLLGYKSPDGTYHLNTSGKEHHRSILAITFTNKATDEMKQRIVREIAHLAQLNLEEFKDEDGNNTKSPYTEKLLELYRCTEEQLKACADKALKELLFDFTFFNVSTIDAFFQTVLRTFAREAELAGNYDVEIGNDMAFSTGVALTINNLDYSDEQNCPDEYQRSKMHHHHNWVKNFMLEQLNKGNSYDIYNPKSSNFSNITKFLKNICNDDFKKNYDQIYGYLSDHKQLATFHHSLNKYILNLNESMRETAGMIIESFPTGEDIENCISQKMIAGLKNIRDNQSKDFSKTIITAAENPDQPLKRYKKDGIKLADTPFDHKYVSGLNKIYDCYNALRYCSIFTNNIFGLGLLAGVIEHIEQFRKENNLILLSDTNDILKQIIADDDVPFIYERLGMLLQHFLIDEFQDTSHSQWDNLKPLVKNSQAYAYDNLIIGDEKQSIYRFRDSDPELLGSEVQNDKSFSSDINIQGIDISQNTNWRSAVEIIQFNNTLFSTITNNLSDKVQERYSNVAQQISPKKQDLSGYVKFTAIHSKGIKHQKTETEFLMSVLATEIERQLNSGYRQSDIVILVDRHKEGTAIINYLLNNHEFKTSEKINISSEESLLISRSKAVRSIIGQMRELDTQRTSNNGSLLTSRQRIETLVKDFENNRNTESPSAALALAIAHPSQDTISINDQIAHMECATLPAIADLIISKLDKTTRTEENIYITALQDEIIDFCATGSGDLHSFLTWWDTKGRKTGVNIPSTANAIRIMTIHKSKGLEFPCVHIPFANWSLTKDSANTWYNTSSAFINHPEIDPSSVPPFMPLSGSDILIGTPLEQQYSQNCHAALLDNLNKTYVALTRAVKELTISAIITKESSESSRIGDIISNAIISADENFCAELTARKHADALPGQKNIFTPLNNHINQNTTPDIAFSFSLGNPTYVNSTKKDDKQDKDNQGEYCPAENKTYYTVDHGNVGQLSKVDDIYNIYDPRQRGIIMHNMLAQVHTIQDLPLAVKRQSYKSLVPVDEQEKLEEELLQAITREDTKQWFDGYIRAVNERTIEMHNGNRKRCDRIVWTADGHIDIIDYKTGNPSPKLIDEYIKQVKEYVGLMKEDGYDNLRGFLWYIDTGDIEQVC